MLIVVIVGWSLVWLWLMDQTERRVDAAAASLRAAGWQASWGARHVGGYPFRLDMDLTDLRLAEPAGWALVAPSVKSEAYAFAPSRWVFFIPGGFAFTRPDGGPVNVAARVFRGSVNGWDQHPPRISLEGDDMTFAAAPGAKPFSLAGARNLQFYTRAGPQDQGAIYATIAGGSALPESWLGRIAQGQPVSLTFDTLLSHASAFAGPGWRTAVTNWAHGGGTLDVRQFTLAAGGAAFDARGGDVSVGDDGRLVGQVRATVSEPLRVLDALSGAGAVSKAAGAEPAEALTLTFKGGSTWLGPTRLAPAPRVF